MKVLFVCTGNVCRSPLAEGYFKSLLTQKQIAGVDAGSAGIAALVGAKPFECALEVAESNAFDISEKRGEQLTPELIREVDHVFCMESWQASIAMQMEPEHSGKIALLGSCHPDGKSLVQIPDPRDFTFPETLRTFEAIKESVEALVTLISKKSLNSMPRR
jgi:protein-tyrosine-phosphatase